MPDPVRSWRSILVCAVAVVGAGAVCCKMFTAVLPTGPASGFIITPDAPGKAGGLPVVSVSTQAGLPGRSCAHPIARQQSLQRAHQLAYATIRSLRNGFPPPPKQ